MRHLSVVLLLALAGCQSQWYLQHDRPELATTDVIVRTDPSGAAVSLNGVPQNVAPVRIPIEYHHVEQLCPRTLSSACETVPRPRRKGCS